MVYSKPLGGKSRIVKLVREMKKKIGSFTWAVLYMGRMQGSNLNIFDSLLKLASGIIFYLLNLSANLLFHIYKHC